MGKYPGLVLRGSVFQYRKRVPEDVRSLIADQPDRWRRLSVNPGAPLEKWRDLLQPDGGVRSEVTRSLGTGDRREAQRRYLDTAREISRDFDAILSRMRAEEPTATDDNLRALASDYFASREEAIEAEINSADVDLETIEANWRDDLIDLSNGDPLATASLVSRASRMLIDAGFAADDHAGQSLASYLRRAERMLLESRIYDPPPKPDALFANARGQELPRSGNAVVPERNPSRLVSIREVYKLYSASKVRAARSAKTVIGYEYVWSLIEDCFDVSKPLSSVTRDETRRFAEVLRVLPPNWRKKKGLKLLTTPKAAEEAVRVGLKPIAANTLYGYLSDLSAFFEWAQKEDYVDKNVAQALTDKPSGLATRRRLEFSINDLGKLFGTDYRREARKNGAAKPLIDQHELPNDPRYWAPLIALFTGMRLGEICQLTRREVHEVDGIPCIITMFDIADDEAHSEQEEEEIVRTMKTSAALRAIPIVDELHRLGFWDLAQRLPEGSSERLFPTLKADQHGYIAAPVSRWFARYKAKVGLADRRKVFHSLRHTFRSAMRRAEVSHDVAVKVGGWSGKGLSDHYGTDHLVTLAHRQLNRIRYEGLDLSHLHRHDPN